MGSFRRRASGAYIRMAHGRKAGGTCHGFSSPEASAVILWAIPAFLGFITLFAYHMVQSRISSLSAPAGSRSVLIGSQNEIERRDALEIFAREHFDNVYFSVARCLLNINATAAWSEYNSGKIAEEEHATTMMSTKPSVRLARTRNLAEAQLEFVDLLSDYGDTAINIHVLPMLGSHDLLSFNEYIQWRREDREFIENLRAFIVRPGYTILHEKINVGWGTKVRETEWPRITAK
jgi:hypothetical protein